MVKFVDNVKTWFSKKGKKTKKRDEEQAEDDEIREEAREPKKKEGFESKVKHLFHSDSHKGKTTSVPPP